MNRQPQPVTKRPHLPSAWLSYLIGLLLAIGTAANYWPASRFEFVNCDDNSYVYENRVVQEGLTWPGTIWAFKSIQCGNWNPLVWLSHMADCQLYGLKPGGHHVTNLLLHTANAVLLFLVLKSMTGAIWRSAFVAAVFAWHPMHVESVAWIAERKDVLSTLFLFPAIWAYASFSKAGGPRRQMFYFLALFFFALGLMSKPMLVTLPLLLLLLDYWPLQRAELPGKLVMEKLPFLLLSLAASVLAVWAQHSAGAIGATPLLVRLENAVASYASYLGKFIWPVNMAIFYPFPDSIPIWRTAGALAVLGAISCGVILAMKKRRYLAVGWFWFLGTLVPVIGVVQVGMQGLADRYTYIPYIGLAVMLAWGLADLAQAWPGGRPTLTAVGALGLVCFAASTCAQVQYWRDNRTLYEHALKVTSGNYLAHDNLGVLMAIDGKFDEALKHFQEAIHINPGLSSAYDNMGKTHELQHRPDDAMADWKEAVRLAPRDPKCLNNLAWIYATCPKPQLRNGAEAVRLASLACQLTQRQEPGILDTLAAAYAETGRFDEAIKTTREICAMTGSSHDSSLAAMARQRLELYKAGRPYHDKE